MLECCGPLCRSVVDLWSYGVMWWFMLECCGALSFMIECCGALCWSVVELWCFMVECCRVVVLYGGVL